MNEYENLLHSVTHLTLQINARLQPVHRGEYFEDPIDDALRGAQAGEVDGAGTMQFENGEVQFCDIEVSVAGNPHRALEVLIDSATQLGVPKGSQIHLEPSEETIPVGITEGLAVYLNGTDLPSDVYRTCNSDFVLAEFDRLLDGIGQVLSWWQGPKETAFYMYGSSFTEMRSRVQEFLDTYPLCKKSRVERIA
ncbi:MAG: hypothetical protein QM784_17450 [Polyangiaceae bacterium]